MPKSRVKNGRQSGGKRMSAADRRQQLIEVAVSFFSEKGFRGASTKEIAKAAGVTEAIIFRLFETKEKFYDAILDHKLSESGASEWIEHLRELARRDDDEAMVKALVAKVIEAYREDPEYQRLILRAALEKHELSALSDSKVGLPVFEFLHDYIARRQRQGGMRTGDPSIAVFAIISLPVYYGIVRNLFEADIPRASDDRFVEEATTFILRGLAREQKRPAATGTPPNGRGRRGRS